MIRQQNKLCWDYLQNDGNIHLAGSCKNMPNAVREEFVNLVENCSEMNKDEAEHYVRALEKSDRYQTETW
jgi:sulfite reductase alpha subunit-like flavoprotein